MATIDGCENLVSWQPSTYSNNLPKEDMLNWASTNLDPIFFHIRVNRLDKRVEELTYSRVSNKRYSLLSEAYLSFTERQQEQNKIPAHIPTLHLALLYIHSTTYLLLYLCNMQPLGCHTLSPKNRPLDKSQSHVSLPEK